jgi:hypothetical protein
MVNISKKTSKKTKKEGESKKSPVKQIKKKVIKSDQILEDETSTEEASVKNKPPIPLGMAEGITDGLEQVDIRSLLQHSGEADQKTRAHLEEELADTKWSGKNRERDDDSEITYSEITKDSNNGKDNHYSSDKESPKEAYQGINAYSHSENFYNPDTAGEPSGSIGEIRGKRSLDLEIQGLSKRKDPTAADFTEKYPSENYE